MLAVLTAAWGGNHFSPLLLMYRQVDGYSSVAVDAFFACYVLGLIPGFLIIGPRSDRHGRKRLVIAALVLGILGSVILALGSASPGWMCVGRLVSGVSVAIAMVVGTSWIKELSEHDADPPTRARRASLTLTAGFGLGAGISGALAQWGPAPTLTPYLVQIVLAVAALPPLLRSPETRARSATPARSLRADLRVPAAERGRFLRVVLPMAPWVFAAPSLSFVVAPALVTAQIDAGPAFAGLLAAITLYFGAAVQPFVPHIARITHGRQGAAGLAAAAAATAVLAVNARVLSPTLVVLDAALFGIAYGICLVAGLVEVQKMADPASLAGLTGIYYSLTYVGFALPVILASLAHVAPYDVLLAGVSAVCLTCALVVVRGVSRPPAVP